MQSSPPKMLRGKQGRYALYGFLLGLALNFFAFLLDVIVLDVPLSWASFIEQHSHEPLHWVIDAGPIVLAIVLAQIGKREDWLDQVNTQLRTGIDTATAELLNEKQFFESLLYSNPLAIVILDEQERIISINPAFENLFQYTRAEVVGEELDPLITDSSFHHEAVELTKAVLDGGSVQHSAERLRKDGKRVPVDIYGVRVEFAGNRIGALAIYEDVSDRVAYEQQLNQLLEETDILANTDVLTGLPNRRSIMETVDAEMSRAQRQGNPLSLAVLDIDHFKQINDQFGHQSGDVALQTLADVLKENKRIYDGLGRWGGDEFMLILPNTDRKTAEEVVERVQKRVEETRLILARGKPVDLAISAGVASFQPEQGSNPSAAALFHEADQAMYRSKGADPPRA